MKYFWWGEVSLRDTGVTLWYLDATNNPIQSYDVFGDIRRFLQDGYVEISTRTACQAGLPT